MSTPNGEAAIACVLNTGNALLKFLSANDVGKTRSHQGGFYLPKEPGVWELFTSFPPQKGRNDKESVSIAWQVDEYETQSTITWYGHKKSEYRLTSLGGKSFPYITHDSVGDLLVLIPLGGRRFRAFLLDLEDDVDELVAALGIQVGDSWTVFKGGVAQVETEEKCVERAFGEFVQNLTSFPSSAHFSQIAREVVGKCVKDFATLDNDAALVRYLDSEFRLFRMAERVLCTADIQRLFKDVEDFLATASAIMQRRRARTGRSLANHVQALLSKSRIPYATRPDEIDGRPDMVIPGASEYLDPSYPEEKLFVVSVRPTCRERWQKVLGEGRRVKHKHIITTQPGLPSTQLAEMHNAQVSLIVPKALQKQFPHDTQIELINFHQFVTHVGKVLSQ